MPSVGRSDARPDIRLRVEPARLLNETVLMPLFASSATITINVLLTMRTECGKSG